LLQPLTGLLPDLQVYACPVPGYGALKRLSLSEQRTCGVQNTTGYSGYKRLSFDNHAILFLSLMQNLSIKKYIKALSCHNFYRITTSSPGPAINKI
jgi:hypothetical protein